MSVDRNYTFRISAVADNAALKSGQPKWSNASSESIDKKMSNAFMFDASKILEGTNISPPEVALNREIDRAPSDTRKSDAITMPTLSASSEDKIDGIFSEESTSIMRHSTDFQAANTGFADSQRTSRMSGEEFQSHLEANNDQPELVNQLRQLQASFHTQAPAITRQDIIEMLSALHQLKETFLQRQRNSITRQELKSELQALRLVMEGRK